MHSLFVPLLKLLRAVCDSEVALDLVCPVNVVMGVCGSIGDVLTYLKFSCLGGMKVTL